MKTMLISTVILLMTCAGCGGYNSMSNRPTAAPTFSPAPGTYTSVQNVTILDSTPGAIIYFTLDGSVPTTSSAIFSKPIPILQTTTIRAVATASNYSMSDISTGIYTIVMTP